MDQLQHNIYRITKTIWPVIFATFLIDGSRLEDPGVWFFRDTDRRIALPVFEQNVIVRLILLDEVVLQQESILLAIYHHVADISYMAY